MFNANISLMQTFFNSFLPGATSRGFFHYIKPAWQDPKNDFDIAVLHMGINDILNLVLNSILHIANQWKNYQVKEGSISSVTCESLLNSVLTNHVNNVLRNKCQTSGYHFIDNNNITMEKLWKDGMHLKNSGKGIIINNFAASLNGSHFLTKQLIYKILSQFLKGRSIYVSLM